METVNVGTRFFILNSISTTDKADAHLFRRVINSECGTSPN